MSNNAYIRVDRITVRIMPKWKEDAKEFSVSVTYNEEKGSQIRVPKPILEKLGNPERIKFVIGKNDSIGIEPGISDSQAEQMINEDKKLREKAKKKIV
jgi:hypothetical protein